MLKAQRAVASYVVSGIGFLGAGAIPRHGTSVRGMTTAATLWGVAGAGIAVGAGLAGLAILTVLLILFTLGALQRLEARLRYREETRGLVIRVLDEGQPGCCVSCSSPMTRSRRSAGACHGLDAWPPLWIARIEYHDRLAALGTPWGDRLAASGVRTP